jgi:hypothetical protein
MFLTWTGVHAAAVAVAGISSLVMPALTGTLSSGASAPLAAAGAGLATPTSAGHAAVPPRRLTTSTGLCGVPMRPPVSSPVPTAPIFTPGPPSAPGLCALKASQSDVVVSWYNRSDNATSFVVYRLDDQGNQELAEVPANTGTQAGKGYLYTDTDTDQSAQCYMIAAVNAAGDSDSPVECTVRPDPNQFPQVNLQQDASGLLQWYGLSGDNDGTGPLQTGLRGSDSNLISSNERFGVNLAWTTKTSLWKVQGQAGPVVMYGEAVALRVWGGGWLEYGHELFGVDLKLTSTPVYQWYILGGTTGAAVDNPMSAGGLGFALWNSAANDFLVEGHQTFGVDLNWNKQTLPPAPTPPTTTAGARQVIAYNCFSEDRPLEMWAEDDTARTGWVDMGTVQPGWVDGGCDETASDSWTFSPTSGHVYEIVSVDFSADDCSNDPTLGQCVRSLDSGIVGNPKGNVVTIPIDD